MEDGLNEKNERLGDACSSDVFAVLWVSSLSSLFDIEDNVFNV